MRHRRDIRGGKRGGGARRVSLWWVALAGIVALAVVAGLVSATLGPANLQPTSGGSAYGPGSTLGSAEAPVEMLDYSDYKCGFCARFALTTKKEIEKRYISTGKVRFVFRDYAFISEESQRAAEAARCAEEQDRFWAYHDKLFENQRLYFDAPTLEGFAADLGLDGAAFSTCLSSGRYAEKVRAQTREGVEKGVTGTPTFFINGTELKGALPLADFEAAIERALAQVRQ